jgi:hypothetical protein
MSGYAQRILRAIKLDPDLYEEVEGDHSANGQAFLTVVLASLAAGIGGQLSGSLTGLALHTAVTLVGWFLWAFLSYFIGTRILPQRQTRADMGELLRCTGFSAAPGLIQVLGILPLVGSFARLVAWVWMLMAFVVAVRQALDYTGTGRALAVCLIGWIILMTLDTAFFMVYSGRVTL